MRMDVLLCVDMGDSAEWAEILCKRTSQRSVCWEATVAGLALQELCRQMWDSSSRMVLQGGQD